MLVYGPALGWPWEESPKLLGKNLDSYMLTQIWWAGGRQKSELFNKGFWCVASSGIYRAWRCLLSLVSAKGLVVTGGKKGQKKSLELELQHKLSGLIQILRGYVCYGHLWLDQRQMLTLFGSAQVLVPFPPTLDRSTCKNQGVKMQIQSIFLTCPLFLMLEPFNLVQELAKLF